MKSFSSLVLPIAALALVSCAGDKGASSANSPAPRSLSQRINEKTGFTQDSEGKWKPQINRRSSFEAQGESPYFKGKFAGKEYKTGDFAKKQWLGGKAVEKKAYQGNTDGGRFAQSSRFDGKSAREARRNAREGGQSANEGGEAYATGEAYEAGVKPVETPDETAAYARRRSFPQPEVVDWKQQRAMTVEQTKGILGRE